MGCQDIVSRLSDARPVRGILARGCGWLDVVVAFERSALVPGFFVHLGSFSSSVLRCSGTKGKARRVKEGRTKIGSDRRRRRPLQANKTSSTGKGYYTSNSDSVQGFGSNSLAALQVLG